MVEKSYSLFYESEEWLLREAKIGSSYALDRIYYQYMPLVRHVKNNVNSRCIEGDDYFQECMICLKRCVDKFDANKSVSFGAFYKRSLQNHFIDIVRQQLTQKRRANYYTQPLVLTDRGDVGETTVLVANDTVYETPERYVLLNAAMHEFAEQLKPREQRIFEHIIMGKGKEDIAADLNEDMKHVQAVIRKCRKQFKDYLIDDID